MTSWESIERKIWRMWKNDYTLPRMARELSRMTMWSGYYALCFVVDYLHNKRGIGFSRKVLRYAFNQFLDDVGDDGKEAWAWLLHLGGYEFRRGRKSTQSHAGDTPILSCSKPKTPLRATEEG